MRRPKYRLSPNEVEQLVKEDRERRRKLRIVQVREQAKANAAVVRNDVRREKERLLTDLADEIKERLEAEKDEKIRKLEQKYENTLRKIGEGHLQAHMQGDGQNRAEKLQMQREAEEAAQERYKQAIDRQRQEEAEKEYEQNKHILARQAALEKEKERAAEIASLPPPPPDISVEIEKAKKKSIPMVDMQAFATTHYHIPDYQIVRANSQEQLYDAKGQAEESDMKLKQDLVEKKRSQHERIERARIRGNEALQKEMLKNDYGDMLKDLSLLQRKDRRRRQKILSNVPLQVFIPPERCLEERQERQMEMERKFEDLYMQQNKLDQLESMDTSYPQTMDSMNASGQDTTEMLEADIPMTRINPALRDLTNMSKKGEATHGKKPETVLKQLLNRIKEQRDNIPANQVASPPVRANQKPLSDIDSQSVVSVESKADWQKTETEGSQHSPDNQPRHMPPSRVGADRFTQGQARDDIKSDVDSVAISHNNRLIEELKRRIELIESQKEKLSHQFQAQASFHRHLKSDLLEDVRMGYEEEGNVTLKEVDITATSQDTEKESLSQLQRSRQDGSLKVWLSEQMTQPQVDLASMASSLRPITGILKGTRNTQYELLTSNGFLPAPDMAMAVGKERKDEGLVREEKNGDIKDSSHSNREIEDGGGDGKVNRRAFTPVDEGWAHDGKGVYGMGARREINFGSNSQPAVSGLVGFRRRQEVDGSGQVLPGTWLNGQPTGSTVGPTAEGRNLDSIQGISGHIGLAPYQNQGFISHQDGFGGGGFSGLLGDGQNYQHGLNVYGSEESKTSGTDLDMHRKLREYREKAEQRQAGMDEETLRRVREYQQKLVQTHQDRKKLLADVREDIERRRQELYASSSYPARGGSNRLGQSLLESWGQARGGRLSTLTDTTEPEARKSHSEWTDKYRQWEPIRPFIADNRASMSHQIPEASSEGLRATDVVTGSHTAMASGGVEKNDIQNESEVNRHQSRGTSKVDKIRKSLSFEDTEESMNNSRISWKDVLNDTSASKLSQATMDESRLTSSEEERGSPVLPYSRSEKSEVSDKSNNSVTGSSSLNGSVLVARAEERRMGFERRQEELQHQLMDIQHQKESILQKYYAGQQVLMQQQAALRSKLAAAAVAPGKNMEKKQQMELRAKLADVNSQIGSSIVDQEDTVSDAITSDPGWQLTSGRNVMDSSKDSECTSGRPSTGTPGNVSKDSYLAEISYYKIKSGDYRSLPSSAFEACELEIAHSFPMPRNQGQGHQLQTWASLLTSSNNKQQKQQQLNEQTNNSSFNSDESFAYVPDTQTTAIRSVTDQVFQGIGIHTDSRKESRDSDQGGMEPEGRENCQKEGSQVNRKTPPPLTTQTVVLGLADHQPHELSTILEVDTPTSSSAMTSVKRMTTAKTSSSQSLSSQGSGSDVHSSKLGSDFKIDVFRDSPYTFPIGATTSTGVAFDLARREPKDNGDFEDSKEKSRSNISLDSASALAAGKGEVVQLKAKRLLDFSQEQSADQKRPEFLDPEEDLFHTVMPQLVELTPQKPWQVYETQETKEMGDYHTRDTSFDDDGSSFQISGYSQYLRTREAKEADDSEITGTSTNLTGLDLHTDSTAVDELNMNMARRSNTEKPEEFNSERIDIYHQSQTSQALHQAREYSPGVVEMLRQQSKAVFGDDSGEGDTTGVSGVPSTSLSMHLEEVSITDTTHGTDDAD